MLRQVIEAARLSPEYCAALLRVPYDHFKEWTDGKRPIPSFVVPELEALLGVNAKILLGRQSGRSFSRDLMVPAVWFKLRSDDLTTGDREFVGLVRRLGFFMSQLDAVRGCRRSTSWKAVAQVVLESIDRSAPPAIQGRDAALSFRSALSLEQGQTGIGELLRPRLRQIGLVVIESSIPKSALEGCCFSVGAENNQRPCIFANTYKSTWFRRNEILLHELCHAIFELDNDPVSLDFRDRSEVSTLSEVRARAFAQEALVPRSVLVHYANRLGLHWESLTPNDIGHLMAEIHAEQGTILRAASENGFISEELRQSYLAHECSATLRQLSFHALTTREYLKRVSNESPKWIAANRNTTIGPRSLRLPAGYVNQVIETLNAGEISQGKAAELLMMDRSTFMERFGSLVAELVPA